jgi:hypothetical protein
MKKRTNKPPIELRPACDYIEAAKAWPSAMAYPEAYARKTAKAVKSRDGLSQRLLLAAISWHKQQQLVAVRVKRVKGPGVAAAGALLMLKLPRVALNALDALARKRGITREQAATALIVELCDGR